MENRRPGQDNRPTRQKPPTPTERVGRSIYERRPSISPDKLRRPKPPKRLGY